MVLGGPCECRAEHGADSAWNERSTGHHRCLIPSVEPSESHRDVVELLSSQEKVRCRGGDLSNPARRRHPRLEIEADAWRIRVERHRPAVDANEAPPRKLGKEERGAGSSGVGDANPIDSKLRLGPRP